MNMLNLVRYALLIAGGAGLLAGCGGNGTTPPTERLNQLVAMTNPMHRGIPVQHPLAHSWLHTPPKGIAGTIWATDTISATVDIVAYPSGSLIGQVAGFTYPDGICSDKSGNVYVADFTLEKGFEIQAGTTSIINSWNTGGQTIGCSVSNSGDVAFTNFYPGGVVIFPGGGPTGTSYPGPAFDWPAGYDKKGHLFVECAFASPCSSPRLAELTGGTWNILNFDQTISFGGGVQLLGAVLGVADQGAYTYNGGIYYTKVHGGTAHVVKTVIFKAGSSACYGGLSSNWGSLSKQPNGLQTVKGEVKDVIAGTSCGITVWNAKKGGDPIESFQPLNTETDLSITFTKP